MLYNTPMNTKTLFATLLLATSVVHAEDGFSRMDRTQTGFDTEQEAVMAAFATYKDLDQNIEWSGAVFVYHDTYYFTLPTTNRKSNKTFIRIEYPANGKIVATFHNHPKAGLNEIDYTMLFSPQDVKWADELKIHSYILINKTNVIREYIPGEDKHETKVEINFTTMGAVADGHEFAKL